MIICPSCNTGCPESANFCLHCGTSLKSNPVRNCNDDTGILTPNETMTRALKRLMPTSYVEKLLASKGRMAGERRIVTILFSDVKGSTALAENLDPEEVLEVMNGAFNVLIEPINRYEGTLARLMGDAILAFFGAPITHEDDPYRACRAALDILNGAAEFSKKLELEKGITGFGVRVGINTGLVVVAEVGTDLRVEYTAMGDAVNIAARMESAAEPGTILITESTKRLVQNDFEIMTVGPIRVKGKTDPVITHRVLDIKKSEDLQRGRARLKVPIIGRSTELKKLHERLYRLQNGTGGIISITGESGVGKSRLVSELRKKELPGLKWAEGRALTYTVNKSYWMVRGLLKNLLGYHQEFSDHILYETLYEKTENYFGKNIEEIYPVIKHFLMSSDEMKQTSAPGCGDPRSIKGQFHYAVKEFIAKESLQQPLVMVWEDLQWCDSPSLGLLNDLLPLIREIPVLLLLQYRIDENEKRVWDFHHNNLKEYDDLHDVITLNPLEESASILLVKSLAGSHCLPKEIQDRVIKKSEGNPSFIEEAINSIIDHGLNAQNSHSSEINIAGSELQVPDQLQNVIMARVDCLDPLDKITLQTASVIGRVFQKKLLTRVMKDKMSEPDIEKSLNELQLREFIFRHLPSNISPGKIISQKEFIFKQDMAQEVLYNSLLLSHRQNLHRQIGEAMESLSPGTCEEFADSLANNFERGKVFDRAIHYYRIAAERAKELFANEDAVFFYSKILRLSEEFQVENNTLAQIHESLGETYFTMAEYPNALEHFRLSLNYNKDSSSPARIYYKCGKVFELWGKYEQAMESYNDGLRLVSYGNENVLMARIYAGMGMVYYRQSNLAEAEKFNTMAITILKEAGSKEDLADVYNNLGIIYSRSADFEKSLQYHESCLGIRKQAGIPGEIAASYNNLGYLFQLKNDLEKAIEYYNLSREICEKTGNLHGLARIYDNMGQIYLSLDKQETAMDYSLKSAAILGKIAGDGSYLNSDIWLQSGVW